MALSVKLYCRTCNSSYDSTFFTRIEIAATGAKDHKRACWDCIRRAAFKSDLDKMYETLSHHKIPNMDKFDPRTPVENFDGEGFVWNDESKKTKPIVFLAGDALKRMLFIDAEGIYKPVIIVHHYSKTGQYLYQYQNADPARTLMAPCKMFVPHDPALDGQKHGKNVIEMMEEWEEAREKARVRLERIKNAPFLLSNDEDEDPHDDDVQQPVVQHTDVDGNVKMAETSVAKNTNSMAKECGGKSSFADEVSSGSSEDECSRLLFYLH